MPNFVVKATVFANEDGWFYEITSDGSHDRPADYAPAIGPFDSKDEAEHEASDMLARLHTRLEKVIEEFRADNTTD